MLIDQPADGDVVFVRRFTRDPPVLATYLRNLRQFITSPTLDLYLSGTSIAGTFTATFSASIPVFALPGWTATSGTGTLFFLTLPTSQMALGVVHGGGIDFWTQPILPLPLWQTSQSFTISGGNPYVTPDRMALLPTSSTGQLLPASLISAWRPQ